MKYIDLDELPWFSKEHLAEHQLDRAIRLVLEEGDAISGVTLAGAAEEILGKLVDRQGGTPSLKGFVDGCVQAGRKIHGEEWHPKTFAEMSNFTRNELKHLGTVDEVTVSLEDACELIDRAVENLSMLGRDTEQVRLYVNWRHSQL